MLEVTDRVVIRGELEQVYRCFWDPGLWPRITSHVTGIEMLESGEGRQRFRMRVRANGREHAVETERAGVPNRSITYRQTRPPALLREHSGEWSFAAVPEGVAVTLVHRAVIDEEAAQRELGAASGEEAQRAVGDLLRRNGRTTLLAVKELIESRGGPDEEP